MLFFLGIRTAVTGLRSGQEALVERYLADRDL
jgi:hypothetical protein